MTDEGANKIADAVWDEHSNTEDGQLKENGLFSDMVKAGYRAGLEEATVELERLLDLPDDIRTSTMDIYDLKRWLYAKLKEQS